MVVAKIQCKWRQRSARLYNQYLPLCIVLCGNATHPVQSVVWSCARYSKGSCYSFFVLNLLFHDNDSSLITLLCNGLALHKDECSPIRDDSPAFKSDNCKSESSSAFQGTQSRPSFSYGRRIMKSFVNQSSQRAPHLASHPFSEETARLVTMITVRAWRRC